MPLKTNPDGTIVDASKLASTPVAPKAQQEQSFWDRLGGWTGAGAAAIRGATGLASAEGLLPGALISGAGELGAEALEGSLFKQSPLRTAAKVGTAGAIGAIPFGSTIKAGKALASVGRSAAYSGGGEFARELAAGEGISPRQIATSTAIGGATGGALGKILGMVGREAAPVSRGFKAGEEFTSAYPTKEAYLASKPPVKAEPPPWTSTKGSPYYPEMGPQVPGTESGRVQKIMAKEAAVAAKEKANQTALNKIETAMAESGAERQPPSFGESISAKTPEGETISQRTSFKRPKAEEGPAPQAAARTLEDILGKPVAATQPAAESSLAQLFKTKQGAAGQNYRLAQEAAAKGEIPTTDYARKAALQESYAGAQEAKAAGAEAPAWVKEQSDLVDRFNNEKGFIATDPLTRLASGGLGALIGAPVGAAMGGEGHKGEGALVGGLAGGAIGAGVPNVAQGAQRLVQQGVGPTIKKAVETVPRWQRFSLLSSNPNSLLANVFAGPWGSGVTMGLEKMGAGDPRGLDLLKNMLNVKQLGKDFWGHLGPAENVIGRSEGEALGPGSSLVQRTMASPGTAMTAGDMAAKSAIEKAGFTAPEASRATLTSEPELFGFKKVADFGKGKPNNPNDLTKSVLDLSFPFKRTIANIGEQGAMRFPVLGSLVQKMRSNPDPAREQLVQQLLNGVIGAGSYELGSSLDPESARTVRKYLTNVAGTHSLMAGAGFAAGQAQRAGKPVLGAKTMSELADALPLPSHQPLIDWLKAAGAAASGDVSIPRGMIPFRNWDLTGAPGLPSFGESTAPAVDPNHILKRP